MAAEFVGAKLRITTSDGSFTGIVHSIDTKKRKLTLTKVVVCSTQRKLHGFHHFYGHELDNLDLIEQPSEGENATNSTKKKETIQETSPRNEAPQNEAPQNEAPQNEATKPSQTRQQSHSSQQQERPSSPGFGRGRGLLGRALRDAGMKFEPVSARHSWTQSKPVMSRDVSDEGHSLLQRSPLVADKYLSDDVSDEDELTDPCDPPEFVQVAEFGEAFESAVKFIKTQRVIGVCCEGVSLGRHGKLCWLVIACRRFVYLFDVLTLGASCFDEGLQGILESGDILKVIHDCRQVSDALFHQYEVKLVNVFDTQVADVLIYRNEKGGELPRRVNGLVACIYEYLNLSPELLHFQKVRQKHMQKNPSVWADRPLSDTLLEATGKHAMYLRELRLAQMERMMAEFIYGVDIYLGVTRDAKFPRDSSNNAQLPPKFKELNRFRYRQRSRRYDEEYNDNYDKPIPEEGKWSPAAWHEQKEFPEELDNSSGRTRTRTDNAAKELLQGVRSEREQCQFENADDSVGSRDISPSYGLNNAHHELESTQFERLSIETEPNPFGTKPTQRSPNASLTASAGLNSSSSRPAPASSLPIFTSSDFPPLSSSDSESVGSPPRQPAVSLSGPSRSQLRAISPLIEAGVLPGRGRAGVLLRNAMTPAARLPAMEPQRYEI